MQAPYLILGAALLALGRRLYWFFVGVLGFVIGLLVAQALIDTAPGWLILLSALAGGAAGALLAIFMQRLGIAAAGFLAGAYLGYALLQLLSLDLGTWEWGAAVVLGVIGAVLMSVLFDWALIGLSTLTGSVLIVQALELTSPWGAVLFFGLILLGLAIQGGVLGRRRSRAAAD